MVFTTEFLLNVSVADTVFFFSLSLKDLAVPTADQAG